MAEGNNCLEPPILRWRGCLATLIAKSRTDFRVRQGDSGGLTIGAYNQRDTAVHWMCLETATVFGLPSSISLTISLGGSRSVRSMRWCVADFATAALVLARTDLTHLRGVSSSWFRSFKLCPLVSKAHARVEVRKRGPGPNTCMCRVANRVPLLLVCALHASVKYLFASTEV